MPQVRYVPRVMMILSWTECMENAYCQATGNWQSLGFPTCKHLQVHPLLQAQVSKIFPKKPPRHYLSVLSGACLEPSYSEYSCFYP